MPELILYVDCPWKVNDRKNPNTKFGMGACRYPLMKDEDILKMDFSKIRTNPTLIFSWVISHRLDFGIDSLRHWGFDYKTIGFNWFKVYKKSYKKPVFGPGYYSKASSEICLLGKYGKKPLKPTSNYVRQCVITDEDGNELEEFDESLLQHSIISPVEGHSSKPDCIRDKIFEMFGPNRKYIELFARSKDERYIQTGLDFDGLDVNEFLNNSELYCDAW